MRAMFWAGSVVVALAAVVGAGRLWAEGKDQKPAKPAALRTRIGLINLTYVIKNYKKYTNFQEELKAVIKPFQEREAKLRKQVEKLAKKGNQKIVPAKSEDMEEKLKELQREIEDNNAEAKRAIGKKSDAAMKICYLDVIQGAQHYAIAHGFDLMLHYNDATTPEDYFSVPTIARRLQTAGLMPAYAAPGMDITKEITEVLNRAQEKDTP